MNTRLILLPLTIVALNFVNAEEKPTATEPNATGVPVEIFDPKALEVLRGKTGQIITIEGTLVRVGESKSGTHRYLNFTKTYPSLEHRISQKHVAAYLGMTPEHLSRLKSRLAKGPKS